MPGVYSGSRKSIGSTELSKGKMKHFHDSKDGTAKAK